MHTLAKWFSWLCGLLVVAVAARYGFKTSDNEYDAAIWAFTYAAVTLGGLFGHALAVRAWGHSKMTGALVFLASALALIISLSNEIGAMAGRGNEQSARRTQIANSVRDTRARKERLQSVFA